MKQDKNVKHFTSVSSFLLRKEVNISQGIQLNRHLLKTFSKEISDFKECDVI